MWLQKDKEELEDWKNHLTMLMDKYHHRRIGRLLIFDWEPGFPMVWGDMDWLGIVPREGDQIAFDSGIPGNAQLFSKEEAARLYPQTK